MLASRTYALLPSVCARALNNFVSYLLGIYRTLQLCHVIGFAHSAQKDGLELVHSSIGKEEGRVIVGYDGGGGNWKTTQIS
jgi:hypothetical protein